MKLKPVLPDNPPPPVLLLLKTCEKLTKKVATLHRRSELLKLAEKTMKERIASLESELCKTKKLALNHQIAEKSLNERMALLETSWCETQRLAKTSGRIVQTLMAQRLEVQNTRASRSCDLCEEQNGVICSKCFYRHKHKVKRALECKVDRAVLQNMLNGLVETIKEDLALDDAN